MDNIRKKACHIVDLFDTFLMSKGIQVPCENPMEQIDRRRGGNALHGLEFVNLMHAIDAYLRKEEENGKL